MMKSMTLMVGLYLVSASAWAQDNMNEESTTGAAAGSTDTVPEDEGGEVKAKKSALAFRGGAQVGLLVFYPGPSVGAQFTLRAGVRVHEMFSTYAEFGSGFGIGIGGSASESGGGVSISAASFWRLSAMGEFSYGPLVIALGPSLVNGTWAGVSQSVESSGTASQSVYAAGGYFPGLSGRIGVGFGRTHKFSMGIEATTIFGSVSEVSQSGGSSGASQSVNVGDSTVAVVPALMFGWDMN